MNQERLHLEWDTYTDHLREILHDMRNSNELTDVTLICEDKKQFKAHRNILSACSPVFKSIICDYLSTNPIIYLRGIQSCELESILQFIYLGKATFYRERINEFLQVAKILEIKEIDKSMSSDMDNNDVEHFNVETELICKSEDVVLNTDEEEIGEQSNNSEQYSQILESKEKKYKCGQCDRQYSHKSDLGKHIKTAHEGVNYPCLECSYKATSSSAISQHKKSVHEGSKYPCNLCDKEYSSPSSLQFHKKNIHQKLWSV